MASYNVVGTGFAALAVISLLSIYFVGLDVILRRGVSEDINLFAWWADAGDAPPTREVLDYYAAWYTAIVTIVTVIVVVAWACAWALGKITLFLADQLGFIHLSAG